MAAIKKYGWENFSHEILAVVYNVDQANLLEQHYISMYKATDPNFGYNIALGGKNHLHSDYEKQRMSEIMKKKWQDPEFRQKVKQGTENTSIERVYHNKKILCVETGEVFNNQSSAAKAVGLKSSAGISKCCLGERKTAGGYHWQFIEGE